MDHLTDEPSLVLLPEREARERLAGHVLSFAVLRPPYSALGCGTLRVLRVLEDAGTTRLVAGYERYERLPS